MKTYQSWKSPGGTATLTTKSQVEKMKANETIESGAALEYEFDAATWEEACSVHHLRQGFEPYQPSTESKKCPTCDAWYFPDGSGECWRCG